MFKTYIEDECIFLGGVSIEQTPEGDLVPKSPNFGHFIFEYLNRFAIFDLYGLTHKFPIVIYETVPEHWRGFLELLGISRDRIIRIPAMETQAFRKVWVSSAPHYRGSDGQFRIWGEGLHWMHARMLAAIGGPRIGKRRRLYLGRGDAKWRRVVNEAEVKALLADYGFESPQMHLMTPREQIKTISGASVVIAAGGTNAILSHFAPQHSAHILLQPRDVGTGPWGGLGAAVFLRQIYDRIDGDPEITDSTRPNVYGKDETSNYHVNLGELRSKVEFALRHAGDSRSDDALKL